MAAALPAVLPRAMMTSAAHLQEQPKDQKENMTCTVDMEDSETFLICVFQMLSLYLLPLWLESGY